MQSNMIRGACFSIGLAAAIACKPKPADTASQVASVTGVDERGEAALTLAALSVGSASGPLRFGVIECRDGKALVDDAKPMAASTWGSLLENPQMVQGQVLLAADGIRLRMNKDRPVDYRLDNCKLLKGGSTALLKATDLDARIGGFAALPAALPADLAEAAKIEARYLSMQAAFLAIRGGYVKDRLQISHVLASMTGASAEVIAANEGRPEVQAVATQIAQFDEYFNPCVSTLLSGEKAYLGQWRRKYFTCEPGQGVSNYHVGSAGVTYAEVRNKVVSSLLGQGGSFALDGGGEVELPLENATAGAGLPADPIPVGSYAGGAPLAVPEMPGLAGPSLAMPSLSDLYGGGASDPTANGLNWAPVNPFGGSAWFGDGGRSEYVTSNADYWAGFFGSGG